MSRSGADLPDSASRRSLIEAACGACVCVTCDDAGLSDLCGQLYRASPAVAHRGHSPAVTVETVAGGYSVAGDDTLPIACASRTDALVTLEHLVTGALLQACGHLTQIHASGAVVEGEAVIALGGSSAGKSSLALAWTLSGYPSLGDDVVLVDGDGMARPFPRHFKLDPELLRSYGLDPESTPFWNPTTQEAWFTPDGISGWAVPAPLGLVALCRRSAGAKLAISRLSRAAGVNALLHSLLDTGLDARSSFQRIVDALQRAAVVEVRFASSREAASAIAECLA